MDIISIAITLFLIMDPLGNSPIFIAVLKSIDPKRRIQIIFRESLIALAVMTVFLFSGKSILKTLGLSKESIAIGGGLVLMIIALRMIFPVKNNELSDEGDPENDEPFIVPLAIPLFAGPSLIATLVLMTERAEVSMSMLFIAMLIAWATSSGILLCANYLNRILGQKGLRAIERLMGMILVCLSVQMFLDGVSSYIVDLLGKS